MPGPDFGSSVVVSEYQCYQWRSVGRSLSPKERGEVSGLSSHISVRSDSAEVTYHWGDFKHDPVSILERYFDLFLYEANWGTQRVVFRFGADTVEVEDLRAYVVGEVITVAEKGSEVLVEAWFDENWVEPVDDYYAEYEETDWRIDVFEVIHRQLMEGDYRGLFLLWLKACELDPDEESDGMVAVPRGMGELGDEHRILAEFVGVDRRVINAAAEHSDPLLRGERQRENLERYLPKLPLRKKEEYLQRLLSGDATAVQSALKRELRSQAKRPPRSRSGKSVSFCDLADAARRVAEREERRIKEEKEKRRHDYLEELGRREDEIWDRVHELVSEKKSKAYDEAVLLLRGLEDLWTTREDREHFLSAVRVLADEFPRLTGFRRRLEEAGWLELKKEDIRLKMRRERWLDKNPMQREIDLKW